MLVNRNRTQLSWSTLIQFLQNQQNLVFNTEVNTNQNGVDETFANSTTNQFLSNHIFQTAFSFFINQGARSVSNRQENINNTSKKFVAFMLEYLNFKNDKLTNINSFERLSSFFTHHQFVRPYQAGSTMNLSANLINQNVTSNSQFASANQFLQSAYHMLLSTPTFTNEMQQKNTLNLNTAIKPRTFVSAVLHYFRTNRRNQLEDNLDRAQQSGDPMNINKEMIQSALSHWSTSTTKHESNQLTQQLRDQRYFSQWITKPENKQQFIKLVKSFILKTPNSVFQDQIRSGSDASITTANTILNQHMKLSNETNRIQFTNQYYADSIIQMLTVLPTNHYVNQWGRMNSDFTTINVQNSSQILNKLGAIIQELFSSVSTSANVNNSIQQSNSKSTTVQMNPVWNFITTLTNVKKTRSTQVNAEESQELSNYFQLFPVSSLRVLYETFITNSVLNQPNVLQSNLNSKSISSVYGKMVTIIQHALTNLGQTKRNLDSDTNVQIKTDSVNRVIQELVQFQTNVLLKEHQSIEETRELPNMYLQENSSLVYKQADQSSPIANRSADFSSDESSSLQYYQPQSGIEELESDLLAWKKQVEEKIVETVHQTIDPKEIKQIKNKLDILDVDRIIDQVYREIEQKIMSERQRKGLF